MKSNHQMRLGGRAKARVIRPDGSIKSETGWNRNLILNGGLADGVSAGKWLAMLTYCRAGTGTSATKAALNGTYAQTGTTITRSTGTGTFSAGDVGKHIKFGTGEERRITSFTSSTEVEVRESGAVSATTLDLYETETTSLDAEVKNTNTLNGDAGANTATPNTSTGALTVKRTFDFSAEVGTVNYNEIGISRGTGTDLFARIVLDSTVSVNAGEQLQIVYEVVLTCPTWLSSTPITPTITGWPYAYTVTDITHGGASFDVTFSIDHHYLAGDEITISNAVPTQVAISTISSTVSEFTVTTSAAHGLSVSDSIEIEGASPGGYNGTWTVAAVDSTTVFRVTSGINLGAGSGGTVRLSTPSPYFNGTWTVASVPTLNSIRITDATISTGFDSSNGDVVGTLDGDVRLWSGSNIVCIEQGLSAGRLELCDFGNNASLFRCCFYEDGNEIATLGLGVGTTIPAPDYTASRSEVFGGYDSDEQSITRTFTFDIDEANSTTLKQFFIQGNDTSGSAIVVTFDQNQRKDSDYTLAIGYKVTVRQDLP